MKKIEKDTIKQEKTHTKARKGNIQLAINYFIGMR